MQKDIRGTRTERNLQLAFAGEAQARTRYLCYAEQARQAGSPEVAELFEQMERNEREHARLWFSALYGPATPEESLRQAAQAENAEWKHTYPGYARIAREEGFEELAVLFERIAAIENDHEKRFVEALLQEQNRTAQSKSAASPPPDETTDAQEGYRCILCGDVEPSPLMRCPVCGGSGCFLPL
jgi:rubrerythrin